MVSGVDTATFEYGVGLGVFYGERVRLDAVVFEELVNLHGCARRGRIDKLVTIDETPKTDRVSALYITLI
ncbi:hypothetical protein GCM10023155_45990 [Bremerella cremea]